jgi:hypothetical protein
MNEARLIGHVKKIGTLAAQETIRFHADAMNRSRHDIHRALGQSAAAMRICMMSLDDTLDNVEDEWAVKRAAARDKIIVASICRRPVGPEAEV